jgi:hypothetical protein
LAICAAFITKLVRELNSEVTQADDTLHRNKVARHGTAVPQRVEGGNSGAQQEVLQLAD